MEIQESEVENISNYEFWTDGYNIRVGYDVSDKDRCLTLKYSELENLRSELNMSPSSVRLGFDKYIIYEISRELRVIKATESEEVVRFNLDGLYPFSAIKKKATKKRRNYNTKKTIRKFLQSEFPFQLHVLDIEEKKHNNLCSVRITQNKNSVNRKLIDKLENENSILNRSIEMNYNPHVSSIVYNFRINDQTIIE